MNKNEFWFFAREAFRHNATDVAVDKIVAQWESDIRNVGQQIAKDMGEKFGEMLRERVHLYECGCENQGGLGCDYR